jgi:hypothetical protein
MRTIGTHMKNRRKWVLSSILGFLTFLILLWLALFYSLDYRPKLEANRAIKRFHQQMNEGEFGRIRDDAGSYSNLGKSPEEWTASLGKIRDSLGKFKAVKTSLIKCEAGPVFICRAYCVSAFEKRETTELFRFSRATGRLRLVEYSVLIEGQQFPPRGG